MAEAPTAPAPQETAPQPAPILNMEGLDAAMAHARQTADAQQSASVNSPSRAPAAQEQAPAAPAPAQPQPVQPAESDDDAQEDGDEGQPPADPNAPPKPPSRMGRLREQLTQAEQAKRDAETRLQERLGADLKVRQKYAALLGTAEEKAQLEGVLANSASPDYEVRQARTRLAQMRQAQDELAPLWKAAQEDVFGHFIQGLETLRGLEGMDEESHQSLYKASSGVEALKRAHGIGFKAGTEASKGEVADLKAKVSSLQTKLAASGAQPANGGGLAPGAANGLAGLLGADGLPTEEAITRAKNREFITLGQQPAA